MEPNQNVPSEEKEKFYKAILGEQPPIEWSTGAWNGPVIELDPNDPFGDMVRLFSRGIHVTFIVTPEQGWPVAYHCPLCKRTDIVLSPWAIKPEDGDYWRINAECVSEEFGHRHSMMLAMGMTEFPYSVEIEG